MIKEIIGGKLKKNERKSQGFIQKSPEKKNFKVCNQDIKIKEN